MEEIIELKQSIIDQDWEKSLAIIEELEEMGRQDKINNLQSFLVVFLVYLIKVQVEQRVTTKHIAQILYRYSTSLKIAWRLQK